MRNVMSSDRWKNEYPLCKNDTFFGQFPLNCFKMTHFEDILTRSSCRN